ncbi:MAG: potassium channel family protein [Chloroflexota bacterium]
MTFAQLPPELKPLHRPLLLLVAVTFFGTAGYVLFEGWPVFDALYMTVMTLTTVGYGEVRPLSQVGRAFTMILMMGGIGGVLYTLTTVMQYVIEGQLGQMLERRKMERRLLATRDHFILCGYGRVGRQIAQDLGREGATLVVIDMNPASLEEAERDGHIVVVGDAGSDDILRHAGIERARGLITAVDSDADNIFVTLSARALNPSLLIVARASTDEAASKLKRAGADRVVSPYSIGGRRMALLAMRPLAVEFVDSVLHSQGVELLLEEIEVQPGSPLVGASLDQLRAQCPGLVILAIKRDSSLTPNPPPDLHVAAGDEILVMGTKMDLAKLETAA